jgi:hypothetical protein
MLLRFHVKLDAVAVRGITSKMFCTHLIIGTGCVRMYVTHYAGEEEGMVTGQDKL